MTSSWRKAWGVPVAVVPAGMPTIISTRFGDTFDIFELLSLLDGTCAVESRNVTLMLFFLT